MRPRGAPRARLPAVKTGVLAGQRRRRWDLIPRRACPLTRFRELRWAIHSRSGVSRTWAGRRFALAAEQLRTGVNETETEPTGWRTGGGAAHPAVGAR